ncbi:Hypothetical predicted protein [Paramuricea clavata]|uniref:Uncharacterized protein n=1 Tax=Paramuricea clavata TaxID=317549 RepID=A0A7D9H6P4_PARCT|nr:Hypothetical predicted protein [Paramuricea clavata]
MAEKTHSEFASHLLQMCEEMRVRQNNQQCSTPSSQSQGQGHVVQSTPSRLVRRSLIPEDIHLSPVLADESEIDNLDVSGIENQCTSINPEFGMFPGRQSSESESEISESSEQTSSSDLASSESAMYDADEDDMDNFERCGDSFYDKDFMDVDDEIFEEAEGDVTLTASEGEDKPAEFDHTKGEEDMDVSYFEEWDRTNIEIQHGPETSDDWAQRLLKQLKDEFDKVNVTGKQSQIFADHGQQSRSVVEVLCVKKEQNVYTTTIMIAAAIIITGGNYEKFALFCKFLGLSFISRSTLMRIQEKYVIAEIKRFWKDMKASIWKIFLGESIILCGDGRNDSLGFSAKYCVYVLMEQFVNVIVDIEVVDKRETGGVSTSMEVYGLKKLLERVVSETVVSEIVTDASFEYFWF